MSVPLPDLAACFQGIVPSVIATCGRDGEPNVTYLSQVYYVDERHVALSCQFFNKTRRNVDENPFASVLIQDPVSFEAWRLQLRFLRSEFDGPLFEKMAMRIEVIASHTGMAGIFKLLSADIFEVISLNPVAGYLLPPDPVLDARAPSVPAGPLTELRGVQVISERIARADDLETLLSETLAALDELLGFSHSMVLLYEEPCERLVTIAMRGYRGEGIGGEVHRGQGLVGAVAEHRRMGRLAGMGSEIRYGRAIRGRLEECGESGRLTPEIPLPGLPDAQAQLALPLLVGERLLGVLAVESRDPLCFDEWDEAFLQILANQIAMGIDRMQAVEDESGHVEAPARSTAEPKGKGGPSTRSASKAGRTRRFLYYPQDECLFVDGNYLIRNIPAKILWKILCLHQKEGRREFSNRELRLDASLGLPPIKDNLESRLILLRKRLAEKCPDVRLAPLRRGHFTLELHAPIELSDRPS